MSYCPPNVHIRSWELGTSHRRGDGRVLSTVLDLLRCVCVCVCVCVLYHLTVDRRRHPGHLHNPVITLHRNPSTFYLAIKEM